MSAENEPWIGTRNSLRELQADNMVFDSFKFLEFIPETSTYANITKFLTYITSEQDGFRLQIKKTKKNFSSKYLFLVIQKMFLNSDNLSDLKNIDFIWF